MLHKEWKFLKLDKLSPGLLGMDEISTLDFRDKNKFYIDGLPEPILYVVEDNKIINLNRSDNSGGQLSFPFVMEISSLSSDYLILKLSAMIEEGDSTRRMDIVNLHFEAI